MDGREESEFSDAIAGRVSALAEAHDDLLLGLGTLGARSAGMSVSATQLADLEFQLERLRSDLEDVDIAEAAMHLTEQENAYQAAHAVGARLARPTLLDYL